MSPVRTEIAARVGTITLNRPERRNALDREAAFALLAAVERFSAAEEVRAIVLTGTGNAFCAGDDVGTIAGDGAELPRFPGSGEMIYLRIAETLLASPKPVIAAVNGAAVGAGAELACAADLRIAARTARIGSGLVHVGQVGNLALLGRVVGFARATEIYLTGRLLSAEEAHRIGLVDRIVAGDEFASATAQLAASLAAGPTRVIGLFKELRERCLGQPAAAAIRLQDSYHERALAESADAHEGFRAYLDRRAPKFTGR
ncbi:enoyl-CoA hydratase/isomerase family protein [Amycolatopsis anabasis]|uniref:enoyl-CoA hydratase/isomerase family protein n=1 Tax=Amycolatopsis anabasis TaxID=1840409 RepID=UPI001C55385F|nr:enoyl-CoA hydratase-related protein [Amycolatopsis anabasis]